MPRHLIRSVAVSAVSARGARLQNKIHTILECPLCRSGIRQDTSTIQAVSNRISTRCFSTTTRDATNLSSSSVTSSRASLQALAEEADRLTHLASSHSDLQGTEASLSDYAAVLQAARELLQISDSMEGGGTTSETETHTLPPLHYTESMTGFSMSLHRSLLTVISWCTRVILQDRDKLGLGRQGDSKNETLLNAALQLARRANDLHLPLHLPLYNQLVRAAATVTQQDALVEQTLEISSWVVSSLHVAEIDVDIFSPALVALVRKHYFSQVVDLLVGMRYLHGVRHLSAQLTSDLLVCLKEIMVEHDIDSSKVAAKDSPSQSTAARPDTLALKRDISQLISLLEPSVNAFLQQQSELLKESLRLDIRDMLSGLESPEVDDLIASFERSIDNDMDLGSESENDLEENIDHIMADVTETSQPPVDASPDLDSRRPLSELLRRKIFEPAALSPSLHDDADSDESVGESGDYLYMREPNDRNHDFPDVTLQFVKLNLGRPILFSALYESILVQSEFDEAEQDLLNAFMMDDSDSDDDNDGNDDGNF